jgi:hypothetical protein
MAETEIILPAIGIIMPYMNRSCSVNVKQPLITRSVAYDIVSP